MHRKWASDPGRRYCQTAFKVSALIQINILMVGSQSNHLRSDHSATLHIGDITNVLSDYKKTGPSKVMKLFTVTAKISLTY